MVLVRGLINLKRQQQKSVVTIGNFDGVHLGHQAIIQQVIEQSKVLGLPSWVLLFEPHPSEYFLPHQSPARLSCFREKYQLLKQCGVDNLLVLQFNARLRKLAAEDFVQQVLIEKLRVKHLVVGDDFRFGYQRRGNYELLASMSVDEYTLQPTATVSLQGQRVSSTHIRKLLLTNQFDTASAFLKRPFAIAGKVGYGQKLGRKIDFPTANVALKRRKSPVNGVFLVNCHWSAAGKTHNAWGVANCGTRPTLDQFEERLEVHLFGVSETLYGIELSVEFCAWIRNEKKFDDLQALKQQIASDIQKAKQLIAQMPQQSKGQN